MILHNHPYRKHVAIGLGVLVIIGLFWYRHDGQYRGYMTGSAAPALYMEDLAMDDASRGMNTSVMNKSISAEPMIEMRSQDGSVAADVPQEDRMIIKNGSMSIVVDTVAFAVDAVQQFAVAHNGFVVTSNIEKHGLRPSGYVTVRIPSEVFDTGLDTLRALGDVQSETVDGRDVTEEYVDLEAQRKNLKASEDQFLSIMRQAVKIEDILAVQRELTNVRSQLDRLDGRMKFLKESAAFSSLTVYLSSDSEDLPILDNNNTWKPLATVKDAVRGLLTVGRSIADMIIWMIVYAPVWIVLALLFILGKKFYRKNTQ